MKPTSGTIIFSSLFFFFVVFVLLSLIVSSFSETFSRLFLVFSYPHRAYDFASNLLLLCFVLMCWAFVVHSVRHKRTNTTEKVVASTIGTLMLVALLLRVVAEIAQGQPDDIAYAFSDTLGGVVLWKITDISIYTFVYLCFIVLPLLLPACKIRLNIFNKWGEWLSAYMPSINTTLFVLFAYAIQPYYDKANMLLYMDLWLFYIGFLLLLVALYRNAELFGFYEYANLLWLVIGMLVFSLCSKIITQADYTNTRTIFLIIGLMSWCGEWMLASMQGNIKPSSFKALVSKSSQPSQTNKSKE